MPSTYSSNLKIELMSTGENSGTWGNITNTNLGTALEQAVVGYGVVDYVADANLTISITNSNSAQAARALVLNVTSGFGSLTQTRELVVPTIEKQYIVQNNTTGGQSITVKTSAGTGITVPNGRKAHLYVDGTNVIQMFDFVDINGGTIDGTPIGGSSAAAGSFTTLGASGAATFNGAVTLGDAAADLLVFNGTVNSHLLFTDNTFDIGASGATRPRNLFLAGNATVGGDLAVGGTLTLTGGLTLNGNVTVGDNASDTLTINSTITSNLLFTDNTYDIGASGATRPRNLFLAGNATIGGNQTLTGTLTVDSTTDSSSTTTGSIQTDGGVGIAKALYVGTTLNVAGNTTLGDASTDTVLVNGYMGVGAAPVTNIGLYLAPTALTGATGHDGIYSAVTGTASATARVAGFVSQPGTATASYTTTDVIGIRLRNATKGAGSTITNQHGAYIDDQTQGTNNYGITSLVSSGTNKWNIYASGTAANYFAGRIGVGVVPDSAWNQTNVLQIGGYGALWNAGDAFYSMSNIYWDGARKYLNTGFATEYLQYSLDGTHRFSTAPSGTIDTAVTLTERFRITPTEAVFNDPGNDYDFRVESDTNTHALFVDAGNSYVGINNSSPTVALDITGDLKASGNTTLGDASTDTVTVNGYMGVGGAGAASQAIRITNSALTGSSQYGVISAITGSSAGTSDVAMFASVVGTAATGYTATNGIGFWVFDAVKGAGSTITNLYGIDIRDQTQGTNNYGISSRVSSGSNKWNIYASGTAANYFAGSVGIGTTSPTEKVQVIGDVLIGTDSGSAFNGNSDLKLQNTGNVYIQIKAGTTSEAGLLFGDTDDSFVGGMRYSNATDSLLFNTGNAERISVSATEFAFNDVGADTDFRVESDTNTHALFVQGSDGFVGVGGTPWSQLTVGSGGTNNPASTVTFHKGTSSEYRLKLTSSTFNADGAWLGLGFGYSDNYMKAAIIAEAKDANGRANLHFALNSAASSTNAGLSDSKVMLAYTGELFVGTTTNTNSSKLVVNGTISETVSSTQYLVASQYDIGTAPNEIPLNGYLGTMAYQEGNAVNITGGTAAFTSGISVTNTTAASLTLRNTTNTGEIGLYFYDENNIEQTTFFYDMPLNRTYLEFNGNGLTLYSKQLGTNIVTFGQAGDYRTLQTYGGAVFNEDGGDYDFRVESDTNTHALFVDAGNSYVGVNTSSPRNTFDVDLGTNASFLVLQANRANAGTTSSLNVQLFTITVPYSNGGTGVGGTIRVFVNASAESGLNACANRSAVFDIVISRTGANSGGGNTDVDVQIAELTNATSSIGAPTISDIGLTASNPAASAASQTVDINITGTSNGSYIWRVYATIQYMGWESITFSNLT